ncbi:MAG: hypothetical protein L3J39_12070 [Verrucomicrobiales bacterium]|nr:hypothetical protein [Verrucomicrobiales bacterium]
MKKNIVTFVAVLIGMGMGLVSCASVAESNVRSTQRELGRAGFKKMEADTPEKLAHLKKLKQLVLTKRYRDGKLFYYYADAVASNTLYVGRLNNFQKYQGLDLHQNTADLHHQEAVNEAVNLNMWATESWSAWGPYGGWW